MWEAETFDFTRNWCKRVAVAEVLAVEPEMAPLKSEVVPSRPWLNLDSKFEH